MTLLLFQPFLHLRFIRDILFFFSFFTSKIPVFWKSMGSVCNGLHISALISLLSDAGWFIVSCRRKFHASFQRARIIILKWMSVNQCVHILDCILFDNFSTPADIYLYILLFPFFFILQNGVNRKLYYDSTHMKINVFYPESLPCGRGKSHLFSFIFFYFLCKRWCGSTSDLWRLVSVHTCLYHSSHLILADEVSRDFSCSIFLFAIANSSEDWRAQLYPTNW